MKIAEIEQTVQKLINKGKKLKQEEKLEEAVASFQKAIESNSNSYEAYHFLGETFAQQDKLELALKAYQSAIKINPDYYWTYHCQSLVYSWQGNLDKAIQSSRKAIEIQPNIKDFHYNLGQLLYRNEQFELAIKSYNNALAIDPSYSNACIKLKETIERQKERERSILQYDTYHKNFVDDNEIIKHALVLEKQYKWQEALLNWSKIPITNLNKAENLISLIRCWRKTAQFNDAHKLIKNKNLSKSNNSELLVEVARCFQDGGELQQALNIWQRLYQQKRSTEIVINLSRVLEQLNDVTHAEKLLQESLKLSSKKREILDTLLWFYQRHSKWTKVLDVCDRLINDYDINDLQIVLSKIKALAALEKISEAIEFVYQHKNILETSTQGMQAIAWTYQKNNNFEEARKHWYQIIETDENLKPLLRTDFTLTKIDNNDLTIKPDEILSVLCIRNEILRLPWILDYHRSLGVNRFFVIDNGSDDGTIDYLLMFDDVHIFQTFDSYSAFKFGVTWINYILDTYCDNHWCLLIDADEAFVYPEQETVNLRKLCSYMDSNGYQALQTHSVDMYSSDSIKNARPSCQQSLLEVAPYYDRDNYRYIPNFRCPDHKIVGGARERVFWEDKTRLNDSPPLNKVPLVKWFSGLKHVWSAHWIMPVSLADISGVLFHFKFLSDFHDNAIYEIERNEHHSGAGDYRKYAALMNQNQELSLMDACSERYQGTSQLIDLRLMKSTEKYTKYLKDFEKSS